MTFAKKISAGKTPKNTKLKDDLVFHSRFSALATPFYKLIRQNVYPTADQIGLNTVPQRAANTLVWSFEEGTPGIKSHCVLTKLNKIPSVFQQMKKFALTISLQKVENPLRGFDVCVYHTFSLHDELNKKKKTETINTMKTSK